MDTLAQFGGHLGHLISRPIGTCPLHHRPRRWRRQSSPMSRFAVRDRDRTEAVRVEVPNRAVPHHPPVRSYRVDPSPMQATGLENPSLPPNRRSLGVTQLLPIGDRQVPNLTRPVALAWKPPVHTILISGERPP